MIEIADAANDAPDKRIAWLVQWIEKEMCPGLSAGRSSGLSFERAAWHGRRLLIFTEWEDTRRWLEGRLYQAIAHTDEAGGRIASYSGLTRQPERERLKQVFTPGRGALNASSGVRPPSAECGRQVL